MSSIRKHSRLLLVAVSCAALGAGASVIASAGAATSAPTQSGMHRAARIGGLRRFAARAVQGSAVVYTRHGFVTVTFNRGKVDSVTGQQLTITEGTRKASYKTVTLSIPATAVVRDNRHRATLSDLTAGQRVTVINAPRRTLVVARTPLAG